jgi:hypothetical protein
MNNELAAVTSSLSTIAHQMLNHPSQLRKQRHEHIMRVYRACTSFFNGSHAMIDSLTTS